MLDDDSPKNRIAKRTHVRNHLLQYSSMYFIVVLVLYAAYVISWAYKVDIRPVFNY